MGEIRSTTCRRSATEFDQFFAFRQFCGQRRAQKHSALTKSSLQVTRSLRLSHPLPQSTRHRQDTLPTLGARQTLSLARRSKASGDPDKFRSVLHVRFHVRRLTATQQQCNSRGVADRPRASSTARRKPFRPTVCLPSTLRGLSSLTQNPFVLRNSL